MSTNTQTDDSQGNQRDEPPVPGRLRQVQRDLAVEVKLRLFWVGQCVGVVHSLASLGPLWASLFL